MGDELRPSAAGRRRASIAAAAFVAVAVGTGTGTAAAEPSSALPPQLIAMYDSPAVQLVTNRQSATVTWYDATLNATGLATFANTDATTRAHWLGGDYAAASVDIVRQLLAAPDDYLTLGAATQVPVQGTSSGTAWGVSADGYLVTNHHVVAFTDDATWISAATAADGDAGTTAAADQVAGSLERQLAVIRWGTVPFTADAAVQQALAQFAAQWVAKTSTVGGRSRSVSVGGGQNIDVADTGMPARVVRTSPRIWPHEDVAILKVDAANLPVVPLGDDRGLETGDRVHALGYPYEASFDSGTSRTETVTATMSSGQVTNRLRSPDGFSAIEDSATINHGNSGGPLVDARGRAVGIVTAVDASTDTASTINGGKFFFAVPVTLLRRYLRSAGVTPLVAPDQQRYQDAMTLIRQSHFTAALAELRRVQTDGFSSPYVRLRTQSVQAAIRAGRDVPLARPGRWRLPAVGAAVLVVAAAGLVLVLRRRRSTPAR